MKTKLFAQTLGLALIIFFTSCGDESEKKEEKEQAAKDENTYEQDEGTGFGKFSITSARDAKDEGEYEVDEFLSCRKDLSSGLFTFATEGSLAKLYVHIKNFVDENKTYRCSQASSNSSADSVGSKFDSCMISLQVRESIHDPFNGYDMHRAKTSVPVFTYGGDCSVTVTQHSLELKAEFNCAKMVQTLYLGKTRNPINEQIQADSSGSLNCSLTKK